jgi:GTP cyclohydrolase I
MEQAIRQFVDAVGERFAGDDLERTPERVAQAWTDDLLSGYAVDPDAELTFTAAPDGCGPVVVRHIDFTSVCVHHLLPFFGYAHVAYLPGARLAGLSKIGRVVDAHARRMQTQERLTAAIVATLDRVLGPRAALAVLDAQHTCMTRRGVRKERSRMTTLATAGTWATDASARASALALVRGFDAGDHAPG